MQPEMKSFLEEGLTQYVEAKDTIAAFEGQVARLLKAAVGRERRRWSPLENVVLGRPSPGGGSGGYGYWIAVYVTGKSQRHGDAAIDFGLWWNAPTVSEPIIYAEFYEKPKLVMNFSWVGDRKGIHGFEHSGRTVLYLPIPKSLEIAAPLNQLLDALLEQLH